MNKTSIAWSEFSSNPIYAINRENYKRGWFCTRTSEGCRHCYSATMNTGRFGNGLDYTAQNLSRVEFRLNQAELESWRRRKKPTKIFVCDMLDLFHDAIPVEYIDRILEYMQACPQHAFQVLTKRAENIERKLYEATADHPCRALFGGDYVPNLWLGVSVESRKHLDRVDHLRRVIAAVRFLSIEPLLESLGEIDLTGIHWVIVGGESGQNFRPMDDRWASEIQEQCRAADVPFFFKQHAGRYPGTQPLLNGREFKAMPRHAGVTP